MINESDPDEVAMFDRMARENPEDCRRILNSRVGQLPKPGQTTIPPKPTKGDREQVIVNAAQAYDDGGTDGRLTDRVTFVNQAVLDAKHKSLTDEERETLAVA